MYLAAAGALVQQMRLALLANNVANINTIGYKGEKTVFRIVQDPPAQSPQPSSILTQPLSPYAPPFSAITDFSQGAIRSTGNPLDVAIDGEGFFSVRTPQGVQYTRQGSFNLDDRGVLVTRDGYPVLGEGGEITLEEGSVEIDMQGNVYLDGDEVGRLRISAFPNDSSLKKTGNGRFAVSDQTARLNRPENTLLRQGHLELANVNPVRAMTEMIEVSRAFEAYQKVIHSADEATAKSIGDVGRTI
jgi:flagellar basal-body rod protein FlgG